MSRDAALTRVLEESATDLLAYLSRRAGPDDAADLLGETMVIAWRRSPDLPDEPERARMWVFGIARGTLANHDRGAAETVGARGSASAAAAGASQLTCR